MTTAELGRQERGPRRLPARTPLGGARTERAPRALASGSWVYGYVAAQFICHVMLLVPVFAPTRVLVRSASLGVSLLFLLIIPGAPRRRHAAEGWALASLAIVSLSALNPNGGQALAVVAHWALYVAVLAPLFWVGRLDLNEKTLVGFLICLWAFQSASSVIGVLQVVFPGRFQPTLTTWISEREHLTIRLVSGEWVPRPMGLTDTPGGAGPAGFQATLFGLGIVLSRPFKLARPLGLVSMIAGMICVYLSQVRVAVVLLGVCFIVLVGLFMLSGRLSGVAGALLLGTVVMVLSFNVAFAMGGDMMVNRLSSLTEQAPLTVYNRNRGLELERAFLTTLPQDPLGAGLGHWGMVNAYFGSVAEEIGAELQWSGWILDGGFPLVITYMGALLAALFTALRVSLRSLDPAWRCWVAIVTAYDVGVLALCFSYTPFISNSGVEFWLLNGIVLHATLRGVPAPRTPAPVAALATS